MFFDIFYTEYWYPDLMKIIGLDFDMVLNDGPINLQFSENDY